MANDLVPLPGRRPQPNGNGNGHGNGSAHDADTHMPEEGKVWDPMVPLGFVDTDRQTAGMGWDLPPADEPWRGYEAMREARRAAERADNDAEWARMHGLAAYAAERETDAGTGGIFAPGRSSGRCSSASCCSAPLFTSCRTGGTTRTTDRCPCRPSRSTCA